ncbi:hypothetical protein, partial [Clostridioides sp. ZZV14-6345]|uniref:hypothetical protein n=1 Tax=Clostridioides sp. ZZV14-6345 TaxID=2811496 RepID=UPI001D1D42CE|nr:hypothetical protein [Clostridioides sp. ZZV14-6345]
MNRTIYSKYSNERDKKFQIRTSIIENENIKKVEKVALTKDALNHINNIETNYLKLFNCYKDNNSIRIIKCIKKIHDRVEFEYIKGKTLDEIITEHLISKNVNKTFNIIKFFFNSIFNEENLYDFYITEEFINIFGRHKFIENLKSYKVSNIDFIFSNTIVNDKLNIIDYEWFFNFPIPINYIIYRSIFNYNINHEIKIDNKIYGFLGIKEVEIKIYEDMESNFQKYVKGNALDIDLIHNYLGYTNYNLSDFFKDIKGNEFVCYIQDNTMDSYSEKCTIRKILLDNSVSIKIDFRKYKNLKKIRIDPLDCACVIELHSLYGLYKGCPVDIEVKESNCFIQYGEKYVFLTDDPQLDINLFNNNVDFIFIEYDFITYNSDQLDSIRFLLTYLKEEKDSIIEEKD